MKPGDEEEKSVPTSALLEASARHSGKRRYESRLAGAPAAGLSAN